MLGLTGGAMAQLRIERLLSAQLILDLAAVAAGLVPGLEAVVGVMDPVGCSLLPVLNGLLVLALCLAGIHFLSFDSYKYEAKFGENCVLLSFFILIANIAVTVL